MKRLIFLCLLLSSFTNIKAQYTYTIKADSVKLTNCDSSELIIENHTQNVPGFLFNTGNGRTIFKRGAQKLNDSMYLIGADTLKVNTYAWVQGGNSFGTTGILGTLDNNHLDLYTGNTPRARLTNTGNLLLGTTTDAGYKMQMLGTGGTGGLYFQPNLSVPNDRIRFGGAWNTGDGQEAMISLSTDGGSTYSNVLSARAGNIGLGPYVGWVMPGTLRIRSDGVVAVASQYFYFGNYGGPSNSSALVTSVSNANEWTQGLGLYPTGQNYYSLGTVLSGAQTGYKRAPLHIGGDQLMFMTGAINDVEAARFTEGGALLLGSPTDDGVHILQVNGGVSMTKDAVINGLTIGRGGGGGAPQDISNTAIGAAAMVNNLTGTQNTAVGYNSQQGLLSGNSNTAIGSYALYGVHNGSSNVGIGVQAGFGSEGSGNVFIGPASGQFITADNKLYIANSGANNLIYGDFATRQVQISAGVPQVFLASSNFIVNGDTYLSDSARLNTVRTGTSADSVLVINAATHAIHKVAQSSLAFNGVLNSSLAVNGPITAQKLTLSAHDWPDYVFDSAYHLPSPDSLRHYIKQNNHLPDAPSAAEVDRKGVDVGDNQKLLLKKIEELTLYMLKQEERIQNLEQQLQQQNKVIDKLKTTR